MMTNSLNFICKYSIVMIGTQLFIPEHIGSRQIQLNIFLHSNFQIFLFELPIYNIPKDEKSFQKISNTTNLATGSPFDSSTDPV